MKIMDNDDQIDLHIKGTSNPSRVVEASVHLPGIEGFQIFGDAKPGCILTACGIPINGTTLCLFQWIREFENGSQHVVEGATNPQYVVTTDDVDTYLAVECTPMDDDENQGELVRVFANNHNKIACDHLPGIEGFQISGEAKPGCILMACGIPINGTTLCIFQWIREFENGSQHVVEGATNPTYVVTTDDVDTYLAVNCTPMDDDGNQGKLVRLFANNHNKIACGE